MAELVDALDSGSSRGFLGGSSSLLGRMRHCDILLVANGAPPLSLPKNPRFFIAVDGGLNTCIELGLKPDLVMGDFDSALEEHLQNTPRIHLPDSNNLNFGFKCLILTGDFSDILGTFFVGNVQ